MKTRVIFASMILGLGLATTQANAATTTNTDDSPAANKPASAMLVNGSQMQFAAYIGQNAGKFAQTTNWQNFTSVLSLYNESPSAVLTISPADRATFNKAAAQLSNTLAKQKNANASRWMNQVDYTTRMINFLWDTNQPVVEATDVQ